MMKKMYALLTALFIFQTTFAQDWRFINKLFKQHQQFVIINYKSA